MGKLSSVDKYPLRFSKQGKLFQAGYYLSEQLVFSDCIHVSSSWDSSDTSSEFSKD